MRLIFYRSVAEFVAKHHQKEKFTDLDQMKLTGSGFN